MTHTQLFLLSCFRRIPNLLPEGEVDFRMLTVLRVCSDHVGGLLPLSHEQVTESWIVVILVPRRRRERSLRHFLPRGRSEDTQNRPKIWSQDLQVQSSNTSSSDGLPTSTVFFLSSSWHQYYRSLPATSVCATRPQARLPREGAGTTWWRSQGRNRATRRGQYLQGWLLSQDNQSAF